MAEIDNQLEERREAEGDNTPEVSEADQGLLKQIREDYRYCKDYWREPHEEAATDMQYMVVKVWTAEDLKDREGRPCICPDELSQFTKQANNNLRQNKRAIKVIPKGSGATDDDAERRAAIIRGIEHASNAQAAYTTAFENCVECSMGFWRVTTQYISESGEVQPRIKRIPNPFTVLLDPNAKEADFSDGNICFVTDVLRKSTFADRYPDAKKRSFTPEDQTLAPEWFDGENIVIAEYWKRTVVSKHSKIPKYKVTQYITNGIEILETKEWPGSWIPIISVMGEEKYVNEGGISKRQFLSLIRRARGSQKALAYIASQEMEEFGMAPRAPLVGFKGQFSTDEEAWKFANKIPRAFLQVDVPDDWNAAWGTPPIPVKPQFTPNYAAYETAFERYRRSIQAAMGISPLPTAAQRQNEKSGVALERIQTQQAIGSFHITDNFDRGLENCGRQINELITITMDTPRQVSARNPDDTHSLMHVTTMLHGAPPGAKENDYLIADRGEFDVTISVGPYSQSEREEASNFVDVLISNLKNLPLPPNLLQQLLGLAIKLKNIGPIGEEIAKLLIPPQQDDMPPQAQAALAQAQGIIQQLQAELQKLMKEKEGNVVDNEYKLKIATLSKQADVAMKILDNEVKLAVAEVTTKAQTGMQREKLEHDLDTKLHVSAHERASQVEDQAHERMQSAEERLHQKELADQQAANTSAQAAQGHEQTLEQQQQAAELQPEPTSE